MFFFFLSLGPQIYVLFARRSEIRRAMRGKLMRFTVYARAGETFTDPQRSRTDSRGGQGRGGRSRTNGHSQTHTFAFFGVGGGEGKEKKKVRCTERGINVKRDCRVRSDSEIPLKRLTDDDKRPCHAHSSYSTARFWRAGDSVGTNAEKYPEGKTVRIYHFYARNRSAGTEKERRVESGPGAFL